MLQHTQLGARATVLLLVLVFLSGLLFAAGPRRGSSSGIGTSVGVRVGWSGGPTGITYRRVFAKGNAFEINAGYNAKEGRHSGLKFPKVGNTMIDMRYQPFTYACDGDVGFAIYGSIGGRARIHNYRFLNEASPNTAVITPDFIGGGGVQFEFNDAVEIFADLNANYINKKSGDWVWGMESGFGIRVKIN